MAEQTAATLGGEHGLEVLEPPRSNCRPGRMMRGMTPLDVAVRGLLIELGKAVSGRDREASLALFANDADVLLLGSEAGESATGRDELDAFFRHLYERPIGFCWEWDRVVTRRRDSVVWFLAEGSVVETVGAADHRTPYRFTSVALEDCGALRFAMLHGAEPVAAKSPA